MRHQLCLGEGILCWVGSSQQPCTDSARKKASKGFKNPIEQCLKGKEWGEDHIPTEFCSCFQCHPKKQSWMFKAAVTS